VPDVCPARTSPMVMASSVRARGARQREGEEGKGEGCPLHVRQQG
jgi:hypothetical protein